MIAVSQAAISPSIGISAVCALVLVGYATWDAHRSRPAAAPVLRVTERPDLATGEHPPPPSISV